MWSSAGLDLSGYTEFVLGDLGSRLVARHHILVSRGRGFVPGV